MVMLYVKDVNKFWVATGYGLEGILPDSKVGRFLDDYYVPNKATGNLSEGILLSTDGQIRKRIWRTLLQATVFGLDCLKPWP
jgi:uncharacterized membrane protein YgcG